MGACGAVRCGAVRAQQAITITMAMAIVGRARTALRCAATGCVYVASACGVCGRAWERWGDGAEAGARAGWRGIEMGSAGTDGGGGGGVVRKIVVG